MVEVATRELRNDTAGVLRRVEAGETVVITVRGKAVADLVPHRPEDAPRWLSPADVMEIRAIADGDPTWVRSDLLGMGGRARREAAHAHYCNEGQMPSHG